MLLNKCVSSSGDFVITIPDIYIPASYNNDQDMYIFRGDGTNNYINFTSMVQNQPWSILYNIYIIIISGVFIIVFLSYLWSLYDHLLGSRDVEAAYQIMDTHGPRQYYNSAGSYRSVMTGRYHIKR